MDRKARIAIVVSHPIQHFCPQYVSFANNSLVSCKVFFASALGLRNYVDPNFKQEISWGNLNLDKFDHVFLNGDIVIAADENIDAASLDGELEQYQPDVVVIYGYFQKLQRRAHRWARKTSTRIAYISDSERRQQRSRLKEMVKYPFVKWYFSHVHFFLSVGDANEEYYRYYGVKPDQIIRMHFPIDIETYRRASQNRNLLRSEVRHEYGIAESEIVVSVVGKLVSWKNQDHIIRAMQLLESQGIFLHLLIVGSGEKMDDWKQQAKSLRQSKVHFAGFITTDRLPAYYAASDFYIHPASIEPHSIAISEAIYMANPVIISDRCGSYGNSDDVQENNNGLIFPFGDVEVLAAHIKLLATDHALREAMSNYSENIALQFQERSHRGALEELAQRLN